MTKNTTAILVAIAATTLALTFGCANNNDAQEPATTDNAAGGEGSYGADTEEEAAPVEEQPIETAETEPAESETVEGEAVEGEAVEGETTAGENAEEATEEESADTL